MPHLTLEYSNNLTAAVDMNALFERIHTALTEYERIKIGDIKSRAIGYDLFRVGTGSPDAVFVHLSVDILNGRPVEERKRMSQQLLALVHEAFAEIYDSQPCDITVNIREIDKETYGKKINGHSSRQ
ncbi:MAG: 5-carboxymethyl-2-hydroxymuconate Delta-isomerase [Candidatus Zixiibacteriota bacterium]